VSGVLVEERVLDGTSDEGFPLTEEWVLDGTSGGMRVLADSDRQEGGSAGVRGLKERYWMRFLKGMVTDRNIVYRYLLIRDARSKATMAC
jgi:hypothetical protein